MYLMDNASQGPHVVAHAGEEPVAKPRGPHQKLKVKVTPAREVDVQAVCTSQNLHTLYLVMTPLVVE